MKFELRFEFRFYGMFSAFSVVQNFLSLLSIRADKSKFGIIAGLKFLPAIISCYRVFTFKKELLQSLLPENTKGGLQKLGKQEPEAKRAQLFAPKSWTNMFSEVISAMHPQPYLCGPEAYLKVRGRTKV